MKKNARREQILSEAALIFESVKFFEKQINQKLAEIDEAINNNYYEDLSKLELEAAALIKKIGDENKEIDNFMLKYKKELGYEKKAILSDTEQKKQIHIRSVPKNKRRKN